MSFASYTTFANAICHKLQKAAAAMVQARIVANGLEADIPTENVFGGIGGTAIASKRVVCLCQNATSEEIYDGNWAADLDVEVTAPASDMAEDEFHAFAGQVFAFFMQAPATVIERLSNSSIAFTAQAVYPRSQSWELTADDDGQNASWTSRMRFQVHCSGSVID